MTYSDPDLPDCALVRLEGTMSDDSPNPDKEVFYQAAELDAGPDRDAYLQKACGDNHALREAVEALLQAEADPHSLLRRMGADSADTVEESGGVGAYPVKSSWGEGDVIERYKLLQKLGVGGMGQVWMAQQKEPIKRKVALKIIKLGMDSKEVVARFEAERQALALMDHPGIAKVLDGGATGDGRPYFVMELVEGTPITTFCDEHRLKLSDRLRLMAEVCHAVQHAHNKGVIHRDLKPSNILVGTQDGKPAAKVIDFGISKSIGQELTRRTLFTRYGAMVGTPAYMSPEQAEFGARDVDTRCDIYSLGVVLYELLVGVTPYTNEQLFDAGEQEMLRVIRETVPPRPSARVSTLDEKNRTDTSTCRGVQPEKIAQVLRRELDWIVMRALEKDRERRYETANGMALEIGRYLNNEALSTGPPSVAYRMRVFMRKHRLPVAFAASVVVLLVVGITISSILAVWAKEAEKDARELAVRATASEKEARELAVRATSAEKEARREATTSKQVASFLRDMLAGVEPSVALGRDTTILREILDKTAERVDQELQDQPEVRAELKDTLAVVYRQISEYEKAERLNREAIELLIGLYGEDHPTVAVEMKGLAVILQHLGKFEEAEAVARQAVEIDGKFYGPEHEEVIISRNNLALALISRNKYAEAESILREVVAVSEKLYDPGDWLIGQFTNNLGEVLRAQGKFPEAEEILQKAIGIIENLDEKKPLSLAEAVNNLSLVFHAQGKISEAEVELRRGLEVLRGVTEGDHYMVALALSNLGEALRVQNKLDEAESMQREALGMRQRLFSDQHPQIATCLHMLGNILLSKGELEEAEEFFRKALAMRRDLLGPEHRSIAFSLLNLSIVLRKQGELDEAEVVCRDALAMMTNVLGAKHPGTLSTMMDLAGIYGEGGKGEEAVRMVEKQLSVLRSTLPGGSPQLASQLARAGLSLLQLGAFAEAEPVIRECFEIREGQLPDSWLTFSTKSMLGAALLGQEKLGEAEPLLVEGYDGIKEVEDTIPPQGQPRIGEALERLIKLYETRNEEGDAEKAAKYRKLREERNTADEKSE